MNAQPSPREAYRELLERGYPYLRFITPPVGEGAGSRAATYAARGFHERHVPRDVALVALGLSPAYDHDGLRKLVQSTLATPRVEGPRFVFEALVGTERAVSLIMAALSERADGRFRDEGIESEFRALGMMLRRLSAQKRKEVATELAAISSRISPACERAFLIVTGGFEQVAAHGKRDSMGELSPYDLIFADDNPLGVADALSRMHIDETVRPNVRLAYLGGEEGLRVICERIPEFSRAFWPIFEEDFGPLETPMVDAARRLLG